jgi:N-methylhydantoinase B
MIPGSEIYSSRPVDPEVLRRSLPSKLKIHSVTQDIVDSVDPLTYEVVRHRLWSLTDEMADALRRMSGSPIVTDANDFNFTVNDEMGQVVQVGLYNSVLTGPADLAVAWTLKHRSENPGIEEGDMFLCNDPWIGGGLHQSDVLVIQPVFYEGMLFGWTSAICHEPDIGGSAPGSLPINNGDIFDEPLPTPPIKIVRNFEIQRDVLDVWTRRSRVPMILGLDLRAKVGANNIGRTRLLTVIEQYGADTVKAVMKRMMNDAESRLRAKLRSLPDGHWTATGYQDQAFLGDRETHKVVLTMTKKQDHLSFDLSGTDPQVGVISCTYAGTRGGILTALLLLLAGDIPWSAAGLLRCIDVSAPEGTLVNATFPAGISRAPLASIWVVVSLASRLIGEMQDRSIELKHNVQASCCGSMDFVCIAGVDERPEKPVPFIEIMLEGLAGGFGARTHKDGISTGGNWGICQGRVPDAEITELLYPMLMLWRREEKDSGGPGRQRGGASSGVAVTPYGTSLPAHVVMSASGKATSQNPGMSGGYPGNLGHDVVVHGAGVHQSLAAGKVPQSLGDFAGTATIAQCFARTMVNPGDVIYLNCQGGGGYGDPLLRDPEDVAYDVRGDIVSITAANELYGIALQPNGDVDDEATIKRRKAIRSERAAASSIETMLNEKVDPAEGRRVDDNLMVHYADDRNRIACCHCGQVVGDEHDELHLAVRHGGLDLAGPAARRASDPSLFVDTAIEFRQYYCPSCYTAVHTSMAPFGRDEAISGFVLADTAS